MDQNLNQDQTHENKSSYPSPPEQPHKRRRVSIFGVLFRIVLAILILGGAGYLASSMVAAKPEPPERQPRERTFTVRTIPAKIENIQPQLTYFGEIIAAKSLDVRAQVSGEIVEIHPNLASGSLIEKGDLIVRIDDFAYQGALTEAQASLAETKLGATEAKERLILEEDNLAFVEDQLELSKRDLERAQSLFKSGTLTQKEVDDRELLVSQREQALKQRQSNIAIQQAQLDRQLASIQRFEWQVERAQRDLDNTEIRAPFDAIVNSETIALGKIVTPNEALVSLYDKDQMNVRFTMSDRQYGNLFADGLVGRNVNVVWEVEPENLVAQGEVTRAGAQIDATKGGVEVYAQLKDVDASTFRPGTFVKIEVPSLEYANVLRLPETAIYDNKWIYTVEDGRMKAHDIEIVARDGASQLVRADVVNDDAIIITRLAQAGEGLAVIIEGEAVPLPPRGNAGNGQRPQGQSTQSQEGEGADASARPQGGRGGERGGERPANPNSENPNPEAVPSEGN